MQQGSTEADAGTFGTFTVTVLFSLDRFPLFLERMSGRTWTRELKQRTGYPKGFERAHGEGGHRHAVGSLAVLFANIDLHCVYNILKDRLECCNLILAVIWYTLIKASYNFESNYWT